MITIARTPTTTTITADAETGHILYYLFALGAHDLQTFLDTIEEQGPEGTLKELKKADRMLVSTRISLAAMVVESDEQQARYKLLLKAFRDGWVLQRAEERA